MVFISTPALYAEYNCYGPGSNYSNRISIGRQLTEEEAATYTIENIFAKTTNPTFGYDWTPPDMPTSIGENGNGRSVIPENYKLGQNYPNPFNPTTTIQFQTPQAGKVKLILYNTLGQEVKTLISGYMAAGYHSVELNAASLASGVYFYRLEAGKFSNVKKMVLMK